MQAHSQARFAILQVLVEAGEGLFEVKETVGSDGKPDLIFALDRSKIKTVGRKAISDFLLKLQVYRSLADVRSATKLFERYTAINDEGVYPWATWRDIIMDKKQPRKISCMPNTVIEGDNVILKTYEATQEGLIQSWIDRYSGNFVYESLEYCWKKDKPYF
jgi:dipeptidyl-peptidase-3